MRPLRRSLPLALLCLSLLPWPSRAAAEAKPQAEAALFAPNAQVDVQRVILQVREGKAARERLNQELESSKAKLRRQQGELDKLKADFATEAPSLSADAVRQRRQEIERVFLEAQSSANAMRGDLEEKERKAMAGISQRLLKVVDGVAKAAGYAFVFDAQAVFAGAVDATAETIATYDGGKAAPHRDEVRAPLGFAFIQQDKLPGAGTANAGDAAREALARRVRELAAAMSPSSGRALVLDKSAVLYAPPGSDATGAVARALESHAAIDGFVLPLLRGGFAYADVQRIVQEVAGGKAVRVRLQAELAVKREALDVRRQKLEAMKAEAARLSPSLGAAERTKQEARLQRAVADAQAAAEQMQKELMDKEQQAMSGISTRFQQVAAELAEGEHLGVVVDKAALLFGPASTDLTNAIIRRYDEKFGGK